MDMNQQGLQNPQSQTAIYRCLYCNQEVRPPVFFKKYEGEGVTCGASCDFLYGLKRAAIMAFD